MTCSDAVRNALSTLTGAQLDALRAFHHRAATAYETGFGGGTLKGLAKCGLIQTVDDEHPPMYQMTELGRIARAQLTEAPSPVDHEGAIALIQRLTAAHFGIPLIEMISARRSRVVARPRQVAMFLSKNLTTKSYPDIGRRFGGRDHTTVMHAVRQIETLTASDADFANTVKTLRDAIISEATDTSVGNSKIATSYLFCEAA